MVKLMDTGFAFGEMALMNNKPRMASIVSKTDCHFGVLNKSDFKSIL